MDLGYVASAVQLILPAKNRRFGTLDALGLIGLLGLAIARYVPVAKLVPFWGCGFRQVTGVPCPGCGLTRAADRFAHFNVLGALEANPLGTLAAGLFGAAIFDSALHLIFRVPIPELLLDDGEWRRVRWGAFVLFCLNYAWVIFAWVVLGLR